MSRYIPDDIKSIIWRRDGGRCIVCGSNKDLEYDHIIPFSKGGATTKNNLQLLCKKHNRQKKDFIDAGFIVSKNITDWMKENLLEELLNDIENELEDFYEEEMAWFKGYIIKGDKKTEFDDKKGREEYLEYYNYRKEQIKYGRKIVELIRNKKITIEGFK